MMKKNFSNESALQAYAAPVCRTISVNPEGLICQSGTFNADGFRQGNSNWWDDDEETE